MVQKKKKEFASLKTEEGAGRKEERNFFGTRGPRRTEQIYVVQGFLVKEERRTEGIHRKGTQHCGGVKKVKNR